MRNQFEGFEDSMQAEDILRSFSEEYEGKTEREMWTEILSLAKAGRKNGTLSNDDIDAYVQMLLPMLTTEQQKKLFTMIEKFGGGPVGLDTLAVAIGEDAGTLEDVYEPYLLMNGLIMRTPRGRVVTETAYHHLGLEIPS